MSTMIAQQFREAGLNVAETRAGHRAARFDPIRRIVFDRTQLAPPDFIASEETTAILIAGDETVWVLGGLDQDHTATVTVKVGPRAKVGGSLAETVRKVVGVLISIAEEVEIDDSFGIFDDEDPDADPDADDQTEEVEE